MQVLWAPDDAKFRIMRAVIPTAREQCDIHSPATFIAHRAYEFSGRTICIPHEGRDRIPLWEEVDAPLDPKKITELEFRCNLVVAAAAEDIYKLKREIAALHWRIKQLEGTL